VHLRTTPIRDVVSIADIVRLVRWSIRTIVVVSATHVSRSRTWQLGQYYQKLRKRVLNRRDGEKPRDCNPLAFRAYLDETRSMEFVQFRINPSHMFCKTISNLN